MPRVARDAHFASLTPRARLLLVAAVFFTFATLGPLLILARSNFDRDPWWSVIVWSAFSGAIAVGWFLSFSFSRWLLPVVIVAQAGLPMVIGTTIGVPWRFGGDSPAMWLTLTAIVLLVAGYVLSAVFIGLEGTTALRLRTEMNLAQRIHRGLVPPIALSTPLLEVAARSEASAEMGGDLIDVVRHDGAIDLYLADVSGHGVRAGVMMAMIKSSIRSRLLADRVPLAALLHDVNAVVHQVKEPDMFATFACLRFPAPGVVEHAGAGHLPTLHLVAATGEVRELASESLPLGVLEEESFHEQRAACAPGDLFILFTDGLTEAKDAAGRMLGVEGVKSLVRQGASLLPAQLLEHILAAVREHGAQGDDQTLVIARVK